MHTKTLGLMNSAVLLGVIIFVWASATRASIEIVERAYELDRGQIISLPRSVGGRLSLRTCRTCEAVVLKVDASSRFLIDGSRAPVSLADWLSAESAAANDSKLFYVFYRPEEKVLTRLVLDTGHGQ